MFGVGWLIENHPEILEDIGILLNEGGGKRVGQSVVFSVEVTQKVPVWLRLYAIDDLAMVHHLGHKLVTSVQAEYYARESIPPVLLVR